jgi:hypothetical protein
MMPVGSAALPGPAAARLVGWQKDIDAVPAFDDRVAEAARTFKSRNVKRNRTFSEVRRSLSSMCHGEQRCQYCEDNQAREVEHVDPKSLYPGKVFLWANYLYACSQCNGPKNNRFAILDAADNVVEIRRAPNAPPSPPPAGPSALINPRTEDPLDFLELDLSGSFATFRFTPAINAVPRDRARARWTIDVLGLNEPVRARARRSVHAFCLSHLEAYATRKEAGADAAILDSMRDTIREMRHPTVFREMQRQAGTDTILRTLFRPIPEALLWRPATS